MTRAYSVTCRRTITGPPEVAFQCWSDPELLGTWMGFRESGGVGTPRLVRVENVAVAPEAGAPFLIDMITREPDGSLRRWPHQGEVVDVSRPARIAFTWASEGTNQTSTLVELTFDRHEGGKTEFTLTHGGFQSQAMADQHGEGWDILMELFSEAMVTAATAGMKLTAAWLKKRLPTGAGQPSRAESTGGADPGAVAEPHDLTP